MSIAMRENVLHLTRFISSAEERTYFTLPFDAPENVERMTISYSYPRRVRYEQDGMVCKREDNIIDLALRAPGNRYIGASGSDRSTIELSAQGSSQGYAATSIDAGTWEIIIGAYKVQPEGVTVEYDITFTLKELRRFQGDVHMHTTGSDGVLSPEELAKLCRWQKLDFAFITDHNNYAENDHLPRVPGLTVIPGAEWTHYMGHSGFLGVRRPYECPFCVNTREEAQTLVREARERGAMIVVNHPFCKPECGWKWGFDLAPYDAVEIWNGPLMLDNENTACLSWWQEQLCQGKHIPVLGGSDFHRPGPMSLPGIPCTCVYALSRSPEDILGALRSGHAYVKFAPDGPNLSVDANGSLMGDAVPAGTAVRAVFTALRGGDRLQCITDRGVEELTAAPGALEASMTFEHRGERFVRFQVVRALARQLPQMPVLISNPIYFKEEG